MPQHTPELWRATDTFGRAACQPIEENDKKKKEGYCILVTLYVHTERNGGIDSKHKLHYEELAVELEVEELMWLRINYCNEGVLTLSLKG